jgi:hypothetical protein
MQREFKFRELMKKYLQYIPHFLIAAFLFSAVGIGVFKYEIPQASAACGSGYSFCRQISVDHTQAGSSDSSSFTILASTTLASLKTVTNGGDVNNTVTFNGQTVPADLIFSTTSDCATLMSWDFEHYSATTGEIEAWVLLTTLSHTSNTIFYMCYGKVSVSTYQGGSVGAAWNANYQAVYHLSKGTAASSTALSLVDSTGNGLTLTNDPRFDTAAIGQIAGGATRPGSGNGPGLSLTNTAFNPGAAGTVEFWYYPITISSLYYSILSVNYTQTGKGITNFANYSGQSYSVNSLAKQYSFSGATAPTLNTWNHVVMTWSDAGGAGEVYLNGSPSSAASVSSVVSSAGTGLLEISGNNYDGGSPVGTGHDEIRFSTSSRSADWILAEYNNEKTGSTMVTFGSEQAGSTPAPAQLTRLSILNSRLSNIQAYSPGMAQVLVVAGGGAGGGEPSNTDRNGGGGAGGVVYDSAHAISTKTYTVTIGAGGTGVSANAGGSGNNSVFDNITGLGGGGGGSSSVANGVNGGSGGGAAAGSPGSTPGSATQPTGGTNDGGTGYGQGGQGINGSYGGGGGGATGQGDATGDGGAGYNSSISGASTNYAGGGGGSNTGSSSATTGGSGGGGAGQGIGGANPVAGTANTGGGGGGATKTSASAGANGGSGVVIISAPQGKITATGGTHTTSGGNDIWTFTSSGTWTVAPTLGTGSRISITGN